MRLALPLAAASLLLAPATASAAGWGTLATWADQTGSTMGCQVDMQDWENAQLQAPRTIFTGDTEVWVDHYGCPDEPTQFHQLLDYIDYILDGQGTWDPKWAAAGYPALDSWILWLDTNGYWGQEEGF